MWVVCVSLSLSLCLSVAGTWGEVREGGWMEGRIGGGRKTKGLETRRRGRKQDEDLVWIMSSSFIFYFVFFFLTIFCHHLLVLCSSMTCHHFTQYVCRSNFDQKDVKLMILSLVLSLVCYFVCFFCFLFCFFVASTLSRNLGKVLMSRLQSCHVQFKKSFCVHRDTL